MVESVWRHLGSRRYARHLRERLENGQETTSGWPRPMQPNDELWLESADARLCFRASLFVASRWVGWEAAPPSVTDIARTGIAQRAREVSRRRTLAECQRLRGELNVALFQWEEIPGTDVQARAYCISIDADPELVEAVEERDRAALRAVVRSWKDEERVRTEQQVRAVLTDPLRATARWFADNQDKPERLVEIAQSFQALRCLLVPEQQAKPDSTGQLVDEFLATADPPDQLWLVHNLSKLFNSRGRADLAERLAWPDGEADGAEI